MNNKLKWLCRLSLIGAILAWLVIGLGAYTRLTDAGLGCPDWPGCYGHFTVPANTSNPALIAPKAWAEMIHRYFAGTLALLVMTIAGLSTWLANRFGFQFLVLGMLLFALVIYQAVLGMWTVTLKLLPVIVTQHLLGGMTIMALLWLLYLKSRQTLSLWIKKNNDHSLKPWALVALLLICLQIALGAWTSTNYAAISCASFPFCQSTPWHWDFNHAFNILSPIGINYQGGQLNDAARMTIQMTHRFGALLVTLYLLSFAAWVYFKKKSNQPLKKIITLTLIILAIQLCLGIINALFSLPLPTAIGHNLCAALLLLCVVTLNCLVFAKPLTIMPLTKGIF